MTSAPSLWSFVSHADLTVKLVLIILTIASVFSWTLILEKTRQLKEAKKHILAFNQHFAQRESLQACFESFGRAPKMGTARLFYTAYEEFQKLLTMPHLDRQTAQEMIQSVLTSTRQDILGRLEKSSNWLATIGSTAPYVGLFGTVWGIMSSFRSLGTVQSASISMVAPGIAEALIATAIGLFAAIPAVIAYNRLSHTLDAIDQTYECFEASLTPKLLERWLAQRNTNGSEHE